MSKIQIFYGDGDAERAYIKIDGIVPTNVHFYGNLVVARGDDGIAAFRDVRLIDLPERILDWSLHPTPRPGKKVSIYLAFPVRGERRVRRAELAFAFDALTWKHPWSIEEIREEMIRRATALSDPWMVREDVEFTPDFSLFPTKIISDRIGDLIDHWLPFAWTLLDHAEACLASRLRDGALTTLFDFPDQVRGPCEQYLLYFADFLRDLGIRAKTDLTHDSSRVLFSVIPDSGIQALARVREALDIYLALPTAETLGFEGTAFEADPRVQQLIANVQHLKSQLLLINAALQLKDATIQQLNATILSQTRMLDKPSERAASPEVELLPGVVSLTEYKGKGFRINLPALYRRFRGYLNSSEAREG